MVEWNTINKRPNVGEELVLLCADSAGNVRRGLGWVDENQEWMITAAPVDFQPVVITHWCRLLGHVPEFSGKPHAWPSHASP